MSGKKTRGTCGACAKTKPGPGRAHVVCQEPNSKVFCCIVSRDRRACSLFERLELAVENDAGGLASTETTSTAERRYAVKIRRILFALILLPLAVAVYAVTIAALIVASPFMAFFVTAKAIRDATVSFETRRARAEARAELKRYEAEAFEPTKPKERGQSRRFWL